MRVLSSRSLKGLDSLLSQTYAFAPNGSISETRGPSVVRGGPSMSTGTDISGGHDRDSADLARFGYNQELKRSLGLFSSFAVACICFWPFNVIFTLLAPGLTTLVS